MQDVPTSTAYRTRGSAESCVEFDILSVSSAVSAISFQCVNVKRKPACCLGVLAFRNSDEASHRPPDRTRSRSRKALFRVSDVKSIRPSEQMIDNNNRPPILRRDRGSAKGGRIVTSFASSVVLNSSTGRTHLSRRGTFGDG